MARGKHAARSNVRRADAMAEHIDRLTEQLTDAKTRVKLAEERARRAELLRERVAYLENQIENDEMMAKFLTTWDTLAGETHWLNQQFELLKGAFIQAVCDVMKAAGEAAFMGQTVFGYADINEFIVRRYPKYGLAMRNADSRVYVAPSDVKMLRLTDEQVIRLQKLRGDRGAFPFKPGSTVAEVLVDLMEAIEAGFRPGDLEEYLGVFESEWTERKARRELRDMGMSKNEVDDLLVDDLKQIPGYAERAS